MKSLSFLLVGDPFLTERKFSELRGEIEGAASGQVAVQTARLSERPLEDLFSEFRALPFFAASQIFRLREAQVLKEKDLELLGGYFKQPSPFSVLIFEAPSLERGHTAAKFFAKHGQVFFLEEHEKKSAASRLLREKLKRGGKSMTRSALARLEEEAGEAPAFLDSFIDQLIVFAGEVREIDESMVDAFHEKWREVDVFRLTDAIAGRKTGEALTLLRQFLDENEGDLISLLGLLHWRLRRFWQARLLLEKGKSEPEILQRCRVSGRQASFFMRELRALSRQRLEQALEGLFQLDWKLKSGRVQGPAALEAWVAEVTT